MSKTKPHNLPEVGGRGEEPFEKGRYGLARTKRPQTGVTYSSKTLDDAAISTTKVRKTHGAAYGLP